MPPAFLGYRYCILRVSGSTFLKPAGTANSESATAAVEKALISVVISSREPGCELGFELAA